MRARAPGIPWDVTITEQEIAEVGGEMGRDFSDRERTEVLQCMETCDVQACPGSGKTTLLAAKLLILSRKVGHGNSGICVLSHTNAARAEVEAALGRPASGRYRGYAARLFRYPHFIGTIQSFIDRYLGIPAAIRRYGVRVWAVDDDTFANLVRSHLSDVDPGVRTYLRRGKAMAYGGDVAAVLATLRYRVANLDVCWLRDGREEPVTGNTVRPALAQFKDSLTAAGCIGYHDAHALARWYLDTFPAVAELASTRFPLVLIDEMQDTDAFQCTVLDKAFSDAVVQRFGDSNQAIYGSAHAGAPSGWRPQGRALEARSSYRLTEKVARLCQKVCLAPQVLVGRPQDRDCRHTLFVFEPDSIGEVLAAFADLIRQEGLTAGPFKAVGAVGRRNPRGYLSVSSYWQPFLKSRHRCTHHPSLMAYFHLARDVVGRGGDCWLGSMHLLNGLAQLARIERLDGQTNHSGTSLMRRLRQDPSSYDAVRLQLVRWCATLAQRRSLEWSGVANTVQRLLQPVLGPRLSPAAREFLTRVDQEWYPLDESRTRNTYCDTSCSPTITIELDTIHGVKGQTHEATLVLETFRHQSDLESVMPQLRGQDVPNPSTRTRRQLPLVYVGMTRPTKLLCLAIQSDHLSEGDEEGLVAMGWRLVRV